MSAFTTSMRFVGDLDAEFYRDERQRDREFVRDLG